MLTWQHPTDQGWSEVHHYHAEIFNGSDQPFNITKLDNLTNYEVLDTAVSEVIIYVTNVCMERIQYIKYILINPCKFDQAADTLLT